MSLAVVIASALNSGSAAAEEPTRASIEYRPSVYPEADARLPLLGLGAGLLVGGYGVSLGTSYLWSEAPTAKVARYPVIGPVLAIAGTRCDRTKESASECGTGVLVIRSLLVGIGGLFQVGGLAVLVESLLLPTRTASGTAAAQYQEHAATGALSPARGAQVTYAGPAVLGDSVGFQLGGRF